MKDIIDNLQQALLQLTPRERLIVLLGSVFVITTLLYSLAWQPLTRQHAQSQAALARARATATRIEEAAALVRGSANGRQLDRSTSLLTAVDQTSRSATLGKAPSRVQPEGDKEVKIWIDDVPFDNVLRWLGELQNRYAIHADSTEIERGSAPGLVNIRLSLVRG